MLKLCEWPDPAASSWLGVRACLSTPSVSEGIDTQTIALNVGADTAQRIVERILGSGPHPFPSPKGNREMSCIAYF